MWQPEVFILLEAVLDFLLDEGTRGRTRTQQSPKKIPSLSTGTMAVPQSLPVSVLMIQLCPVKIRVQLPHPFALQLFLLVFLRGMFVKQKSLPSSLSAFEPRAGSYRAQDPPLFQKIKFQALTWFIPRKFQGAISAV